MESGLLDQFFEIEDSHWWFVARQRIVLDQFVRATNGAPPSRSAGERRILDVGCGTGAMLARLTDFGEAIGIDSSPEAATYCRRRNVQMALASAIALPFPDESFDSVFVLDVLEHVQDDVAMLREIHRTLRPGGTLVMTVPALPWLWSSHDDVNHHQRRYMKGALDQALRSAALEPVKTSYYNSFLLPLAAARKLMHRFNGTGDHLDRLPRLANAALRQVFAAERPLLRRIDFPLGASLISISRKSPGKGSERD